MDRLTLPLLAASPAEAAHAITAALAAHPRARAVLLQALTPPAHDTLLAALEACGGRPVTLDTPAPPPPDQAAVFAGAGLRRVQTHAPASPVALDALHAVRIHVSLTFNATDYLPHALLAALRDALARHPWLASIAVVLPPESPVPDLTTLTSVLAEARAEADEVGVRLGTRGIPACIGDVQGSGAGRREVREDATMVYGRPCARCALRPACAGAPPGWWELPEGGPLGAPEVLAEPWELDAPRALQTVVRGFGTDAEAELRAAVTPTVWYWTDHLREAELPLPFTHLALELVQARVGLDTLQHLQRVRRPIHVALRLAPTPMEVRAVVHALQTVGVNTVVLLAAEPWIDAELSLRAAFPNLDLRRIGPPAPA